jgi:hypothetical protein
MLKALYYPHTDIHSPIIIKNALLLWDSIETIVPHPDWRRTQSTGDSRRRVSVDAATAKLLEEATELIVKPRVPSRTVRQAAHDSVLELVKSGLAAALIHNSPREWKDSNYLIYPEKFLEGTWRLLERSGIANWESAAFDYRVPTALGFLMLSILADSCAGTQIQKVTDRVEAYSWIARHQASVLGSPYVTGLDISDVAPNVDRLVTITSKVLDARDIPLKKLLEFRKRELKSGSSDYSGLRRRYAALVQQYLERIGKEAKTENDVRELEYQFKIEIKQDLADLKAELKVSAWKTLFSAEVGIFVAIMAGCLIAPVAGFTALATHLGGIGVIPLLKTGVKYREARRNAFRQHPISWLYLHKQKQLTAY